MIFFLLLPTEMVPRVLNEGCAGCSAKQVINSDKIIDFMKENRSSDWVAISEKYTVV